VDLERAVAWAAGRTHGVLITIRGDGRAQSSDIVYRVVDGTFVISITEGRSKTRNLRRDPRAVLHVTEPSQWSYVSFDGTVELSAVTTDPTDDASNALVDHYRAVAGADHDDWPAYRQAMIEERRLLATFRPGTAVGQINAA
jgi:PPOX class probable F420-dependent enzyme